MIFAIIFFVLYVIALGWMLKSGVNIDLFSGWTNVDQDMCRYQ